MSDYLLTRYLRLNVSYTVLKKLTMKVIFHTFLPDTFIINIKCMHFEASEKMLILFIFIVKKLYQ